MDWRIKAFASVCLSFGLTYLFAAFVSLEPNPLAWSAPGRLTYLAVSAVLLVPVAEAVRDLTRPSK